MTKRKLSKGWKIIIIVAVLLVVLALLYIVLDICRCFNYSALYSESQHIERVSKRVEKYFMTGERGYTDYTVYPLYDEHDKLRYFLVEFEPYGYVYIKLIENSIALGGIYSMYCCYLGDGYYKEPWRRYRYFEYPAVKNEQGQWEATVPYPEEGWKFDENGKYNDNPVRRYETDENGEFIYYSRSHFKEANIENERMYLIRMDRHYVPAVKRGEKWLNLISMEEFLVDDINSYFLLSGVEYTIACADVHFNYGCLHFN